MIKCEYCGAMVDERAAFCPQCGAPVKTSDVSPSVKEFERLLIETSDSNKIEYVRRNSFESASTMGKIIWILFWIVLWPVLIFVYIFRRFGFSSKSLTPNESKRANIISNYVFDGDRKTLHEALLFIETQIDILAEMKKDGYTSFWLNLWTSKAEQVYEKSKTSVGEDATFKEVFDRIKPRSEKLINKTRLSFGLFFIAAAVAVIIMAYTVAQPYIYRHNLINGTNTPTISLKRMQDKNEIDAKNVKISGILGRCFDPGNQNVVLEFKDDRKFIEMTMSVICKKSFSEEIRNEIANAYPDTEPEDFLSGDFVLNGSIYDYMGSYGMGEIMAQDSFIELLNAQPGDEVEIHLLHEIKVYDRDEDIKRVMEVSSFILSVEVTYSNNASGEEEFTYKTLR